MKFDMRISNYQLFTLLIMHSLGSSTIFARGIGAKQDAWIVELVGLAIGFGIIWIHTELQKNYPRKNLTEINITLLGKVFGGALTILFAGYFIWVSTLNFSEFAELISITALQTTPILAVQCIFILVIIYYTFKNIEVMGRTSEILMPYVMLSLILLYILIAVSGRINLKELQPVLANGMMPVLKEAYPRFSTFPYGEDVVFLMYYCYVNKSNDIRKYAFSAIFMLGIILVISTTTIITVLGVEFATSSTIPLIEVIRLIRIGDIITNIDAIGVIVIFIGGFFKAMLFFYGSVLALSTLFKIKREVMIIVMAVFLVWFNLAKIPNFVYHRFVGINFTVTYIHVVYNIYIPFLLLMVIWLRNLNKRKDDTSCK
ncbi:GerAB/ArcD/ProY family transporter [Petroclostridium sp. X23]|uniref:GerAB/ArcD/ProY family transporter n=1 Tax=Petroclostridium sp. X23 TaxID=3045146 RepID=UPI0024AE1716|nr:GerAB/ArcD/ProY family transporter [Petroclostridium sp. X23]WHH60214.1 GerAB/ArcD/ProY family transporter [Petroclostridium sp. X23]